MILQIGNILVGGVCGKNLATNFSPHPPSELNFHLWRRFFPIFDKINNFQQQKQQMLFLSNMIPKVLPSQMMMLGDFTGSNDTLFREKTPFFGVSWSKKGPHRRFGGSKFVADEWFFTYGNKKSFPFFRFVSNIFIREKNEASHTFTNSLFNWKLTSYVL